MNVVLWWPFIMCLLLWRTHLLCHAHAAQHVLAKSLPGGAQADSAVYPHVSQHVHVHFIMWVGCVAAGAPVIYLLCEAWELEFIVSVVVV